MDKERANSGGVVLRIEKLRFTTSQGVRSEKSFSLAPAAAGHEHARLADDKIGSVTYELSIDPPGRAQRRVDLFRSVVWARQFTRGERNQEFQLGHIIECSFEDKVLHLNLYGVPPSGGLALSNTEIRLRPKPPEGGTPCGRPKPALLELSSSTISRATQQATIEIHRQAC